MSKNKFTWLIFSLIGFLFCVSPVLAEGPGGIFDSLTNAIKVATEPVAGDKPQTVHAKGAAEINEMLMVDYPGRVFNTVGDAINDCAAEGLRFSENHFNSAVRAGNRQETAYTGKSNAKRHAQCARLAYEGKPIASRSPANLSFAGWVSVVGIYLANYALYADYGNEEERFRSAQRAKAYLEFSIANGEPVGKDFLADLDKKYFAKSVIADTSGTPALSGSAESLVTQYLGNKFAFKRQHAGKLMQVMGTISSISGDGSQVSLLGNTKLSRDERGFQHYVYCKLADEAAIDKVSMLREGQSKKVRGIFDPDASVGLMSGLFVLKDCRIYQ